MGFKVTVVSEDDTGLAGSAISYSDTDSPEIVCHLVEIDPGGEVGRHKHPVPAFMYVLEGTLIVESDDGTQKKYHSGDALVEDAETWFNNKNPADTPTRFLAVINGEKGNPPVVFPED